MITPLALVTAVLAGAAVVDDGLDPPHPQDYSFNRAARVESVSRVARELNWKELLSGEERVYYLGERHDQTKIADKLSADMALVKAAGITHVAIELPENYQGSFDSWTNMEEQNKELKVLFEECGEGSCKKIFTLVDSVRAQGLKLVLFDKPHKKFSRDLTERDRWMADRLAQLLSDPKARIVAFNGSNHIRRGNQPKRLRELGWMSKSYCFLTSGLDYGSKTSMRDVRNSRVHDKEQFEIAEALKTAQLASKSLFIPLPSEADFDGYISIPAVLAQKVVGMWIELESERQY